MGKKIHTTIVKFKENKYIKAIQQHMTTRKFMFYHGENTLFNIRNCEFENGDREEDS